MHFKNKVLIKGSKVFCWKSLGCKLINSKVKFRNNNNKTRQIDYTQYIDMSLPLLNQINLLSHLSRD